MNSKQIKTLTAGLVLALAVAPAMAFAVDDVSSLNGTSTGGQASDAAVVDSLAALGGAPTGGDNTSAGTVDMTAGLNDMPTGGDNTSAGTVDNTGGLNDMPTGGQTGDSSTGGPAVVTTPPAGGSSSGSSSGSGNGGGRSGGSSAVPLTISPLYIVRTGTNTFWVAFTTSQSVEGEVVYGTKANSDYENATSFDSASITHNFTITLDPTVTNYLRPIARVGTTLYTGTETILAPTDETIANGATFVPPTEITTPDETGSTTGTVGTDATTTASTTVTDNTASASNAFFGPIGDFFHRMWNYLTRSMCEIPN